MRKGKMVFKSIIGTLSACLALASLNINATVITGGNLLSQTGADQLETWLGVGESDFTNIWDGTRGDTSSSWHAAVDGILHTVSIYDVTYGGINYLLGGYRSTANSSSGTYGYDDNAVIFNLNTGRKLDVQPTVGRYATYDQAAYFATFGGGHDLYGGSYQIGHGGYVNGAYTFCDSATGRTWGAG